MCHFIGIGVSSKSVHLLMYVHGYSNLFPKHVTGQVLLDEIHEIKYLLNA